MKKYFVFFLTVFLFNSSVSATHLLGGEITWICLKSGPDVGKYVFQMKIYRDCVGITSTGSIALYVLNHPVISQIPMHCVDTNDLSPTGAAVLGNTCLTCSNQDMGAVEEFIFESDPIILVGSPPSNGWHFIWSTCCRSGTIINLDYPSGFADHDMTLRAVMYAYTDQSGLVLPTDPCYDSSPKFKESAQAMICTGSPFAYSDNAFDQELDEISYSWTYPIGTSSFLYDASNPDTHALPFALPYSVNSPIPGNPTLNSQTGEIAFSSNITGAFSTCVKVEAIKCGQIVAEIYRDMPIFLLACPPDSNGMVNNPPTITAPLGAQNWNNTINSAGLPSYSTTVTAGDLVSFNITAEDLDMYNNLTPQDLKMNISGGPISSNYIDPLLCANPPCVTFTDLLGNPAPIVAPSIVSGVFEWQTSSDHITTNGCNNQSNVFTFSISTNDDFCPINGINIATIKITIMPLTTEVEGQLSHLTIFPNPLNDVLYIDGDYDVIQIFDKLGKSLFKSENQSEINVTHLSVGTYIIELEIANKLLHKKIQIVR